MNLLYEDRVLIRCPDTGDSDIVQTVAFTPEVSITVDLFAGTPNYRRVTLMWNNRERDYRAELWGRQLISRGPRIKNPRVR